MKSKHLHVALILSSLLLLITCKKDYDSPLGNNKVEFGSIITDSVSYFSAKVLSRLNQTGGNTISDYGICWNIEPNPDISKGHKSFGYTSSAIDISTGINNLQAGKKYYIRPYATVPTGTVYGPQSEFHTLKTGMPVTTTDTVTLITTSTAFCQGIVVADSGLTVTKRGICWSLSLLPTLTSYSDTSGKGLGSFNLTLHNLNPASKYYFRAFAVNDSGTSYGTQKSFITVALTPPILTTSPVTNIATTSAQSGGNITSDGGSPVTARGLCWSLLPNPTISDSHTTDGTEIGTYTSNLTSLTPNTSYYVRAYATNAVGTSYGDAKSFTSLPIAVPTLTTVDINNITINTAGSGGNITSDGGDQISERGVCWSITQNPTTASNHTSDGIGSGIFASSLIGLINNTTYYVRAFATNSAGTAYGNELSFKTIAVITIPSVTTTSATAIASNKATTGGNVLSTGGASVIVRGVCFSTSANPTIDADHTTDGSGSGIFTSNLTGLSPTTTYHIRAYATNSAGTAYGQDLSFTTTVITVPTLTTTDISAITPNTASSGGNITESGGANITARGVCWSTAQTPTITGSHSTDGTGTGIFTSALSSLNPTTTYYVRAYATNSVGTSYGNQLTFSTTTSATTPTVTTTSISTVTSNTATSGGNATNSGGATVMARGVCWSTIHNPTTTNSHTTDGSGTGVFSSVLTGLNSTTTYYVRAYATNSVGTAYGSELSFTTLSATTIPTLTTTAVTNIAAATATSGGNITSDGGATVTVLGVCWSTNQSPTIADSHTSDGTGTGTYVSSLTGLNATTTYYVRAYATNSVGTAYGNQVSFTSLPNIICNSFTLTHNAGSVAPVTKNITYGVVATNLTGDYKCWITQNLGADHQATSATDATEASAGWYWQFNHLQGYKHDGSIRTPNNIWLSGINENTDWLIADDPCSSLLGGSWRIPTYSEWNNADTSGGWNNFNETYASVLKLHAAGMLLTDGSLNSRGSTGICWSSTQQSTNAGWYLTFNNSGSYTIYSDKAFGMSSRCLSDGTGSSVSLPTITTDVTSNITSNLATSGGNVTNDGGATVTGRGVCWSTSQNPTITDPHTLDGSGTGIYLSNITGLNAATTYYVRAYATNSAGTAYGGQQSFTTTTFVCGTSTLTDQDGNVYNTVSIGSQCWMRENLNTGIRINGSISPSNNGIIEKYCYQDDPSFCSTYGGLYQWDESMQYGTVSGSQGICPNGWHIPTDAEWTTLSNSFGGDNSSGGALKETGTLHWNTPNTGASNSSGFTGLSSGYRQTDGSFGSLSLSGSWWTSTLNTTLAWERSLHYDDIIVGRGSSNVYSGLSIRCIKN